MRRYTLAFLMGLSACCPAPSGPTAPREDERTALAVGLANAMDDHVARAACGQQWAEESDGWQGCVCGLETWRCMSQGWCTDPAVPGFDLGEPRAEATKPLGLPNVQTAHLEIGCD